MVRLLITVWIVLGLNAPVVARDDDTGLVTPNDVRELVRQAQREKAAREKRLHSDVTDFIDTDAEQPTTQPFTVQPDAQNRPETTEEAATTPSVAIDDNPVEPVSEPSGGSENPAASEVSTNDAVSRGRPSVSAKRTPSASGTTPSSVIKRAPHHYVPPPRVTSGKSNVSVDYDERKQSKFGIPIGTWIEAELRRTISSADRAEIEITTVNTQTGKYKDLPAFTTFFGAASYNSGTKRLDAYLTKLITPEGVELNIKASLYDKNLVSGLSGVIIKNTDDDVRDAGANVAYTVAKDTLATIGANNPISSGLSAGADTLIDRNRPDDRAADDVVKAFPQKVMVRIDKTF